MEGLFAPCTLRWQWHGSSLNLITLVRFVYTLSLVLLSLTRPIFTPKQSSRVLYHTFINIAWSTWKGSSSQQNCLDPTSTDLWLLQDSSLVLRGPSPNLQNHLWTSWTDSFELYWSGDFRHRRLISRPLSCDIQLLLGTRWLPRCSPTMSKGEQEKVVTHSTRTR